LFSMPQSDVTVIADTNFGTCAFASVTAGTFAASPPEPGAQPQTRDVIVVTTETIAHRCLFIF